MTRNQIVGFFEAKESVTRFNTEIKGCVIRDGSVITMFTNIAVQKLSISSPTINVIIKMNDIKDLYFKDDSYVILMYNGSEISFS